MVGARREIGTKFAELAPAVGDEISERRVGGDDDPVPSPLERCADAGQGATSPRLPTAAMATVLIATRQRCE